jgi:uncharacterized protein (DUF58 family)
VELDQSVASQTFAVLLCLLAVAILWTPLFRARFEVKRILPRFGSVGQPFSYRVSVRTSRAKSWHGLELFEDLADPRLSREEFIEAHRLRAGDRSFRLAGARPGAIPYRRAVFKPLRLPTIPPQGKAEASLELLPLKRGPLRFRGVTLARRDPLDLFRAFYRVPLPQTVLILPKRYPLSAVALPGTHRYQQGGVAFAASVGESEEFVSLRDYRPGDPLRHVHWRSSARAGNLVVKEFQDEFFVRHALVLDTFGRSVQAEAFEEAVSLAASFVCTVESQESLLDLMFVGQQAVCFTSGRGVAHPEQALEILASVQLCKTKPFDSLQALVLRHASSVSGCICIFLAWDRPRQALAQKLAALGVPLQVLIVTDEAGRADLASRPAEGYRPEHFQVLVTGQIEGGLRTLGKAA